MDAKPRKRYNAIRESVSRESENSSRAEFCPNSGAVGESLRVISELISINALARGAFVYMINVILMDKEKG